jgi:hypothetical protein
MLMTGGSTFLLGIVFQSYIAFDSVIFKRIVWQKVCRPYHRGWQQFSNQQTDVDGNGTFRIFFLFAS